MGTKTVISVLRYLNARRDNYLCTEIVISAQR